MSHIVEKILESKDGGMSSRKFLFAAGTGVMVFFGGLVAAWWPAFGPHYDSFISGSLGVLGIYMGANVGSKFVTTQAIKAVANSSIETQAAPAKEKEATLP